MTTFKCCICGKKHKEQAFISHARADKTLTQHIATACCQAATAPFLFEYSESALNETSQKEPIADKISTEVLKSRVQFVLLGPEVSQFWTQAWIGYEIGVSRGADRGTGKLVQQEYFARKIVAIEDVSQSINACVPYLHALLLFDYKNHTRWQEFEDLVRFLADTTPTTLGFYKAGNRFRGKLLTASNTKCPNSNCGSAPYDVLVFNEDFSKLASATWVDDNIRATAKIKCPSCSTSFDIELVRAL